MILIKNIKKNFGKREILKDASLELYEGECIGILGINGSGKSTFLSVLAGIINPDGGEFYVGDTDLLNDKKLRKKYVGYVPQGTPLIEELTAKDNLSLWYGRGEMKESLENGILKLLGIDTFINKRVSNISGGMKKRLSIGCALSLSPKILLLDEPTAALDIPCKEDILTYVRKFSENGGTTVIATHDINEIKMCDRLFILKNGVFEEYEYDGDNEKLSEKLA